MLARLFAKPANVLVLDEPTNDLDLETLELLEDAVASFDGTVLLVSHDRVFLDNVVTSILALETGGMPVEYVGGWQDYLRQSTAVTRVVPEPAETRRAEIRIASPAGKRKLSYNEQRELESLPSRIEALEHEQRVLREEMEAPEFYKAGVERIETVMARLNETAREHDALLARWMELEERRSS
jgi:ATP-binding cassette subfamily F protein uup